jgi:nitronate monooxygenase
LAFTASRSYDDAFVARNSVAIRALLNIEHPIIQAPMAGACTPELVAVVSNGGGLGSLGAAPMKPDVLREQIQKIRTLTKRSFNINLFAPASEQFDAGAILGGAARGLLEKYHQELGLGDLPQPSGIFGPAEEQLEVLLEEKVPVISFHFGVEARHVKTIHSAGLKVICSATTIEEAVHLESIGCDAVIAQGSEAGGHRGTFIGDFQQALIGTMALVPQIVDAVSVPVIAAGGIMDARGIVACKALGASGVQMGTAFLGCHESGISSAWREQLKASSPSRAVVTTVISGKPARGLTNRYIQDMEALEDGPMPYPLQYALSGAIRQKAAQQDNSDFLAMWSGQGVGMLREMSAADLLKTLVLESGVLLKTLSG